MPSLSTGKWGGVKGDPEPAGLTGTLSRISVEHGDIPAMLYPAENGPRPRLNRIPSHHLLRLQVLSMNFLHYEVDVQAGDAVEVTLDKQANVRLLDPSNYGRYQRGQPHRYHGGLAKQSPVHLSPPHSGHWHVIIDLGGYSGTVHASVRVI